MFFAGVLGVLFFALTCLGVALLVVSAIRRTGKKGRAWKVMLTLVSALLLIAIPFSFRTVDTGEIVVVKHLGKATDVRSPGTHFDFWRQLSIEAADEIGKLAEVIDVYYVNPATRELESLNGLTSAGTLDNVISP